MAAPANLYQVLGVKPDADARTMRASFRRLAWQYHPDAGGSQRAMAALNGAWQTLRDPEARARYDGRRSSLNRGAPAPQPHPPPSSRSAPHAVRDRPPASRAHPGPRAPETDPPPATSTFGAVPAGPAVSAAKNSEGTAGRSDRSTIMDFGRYEGWSLTQLAVADPDYLEWLARTSIGRRLQPEIAALLAERRARVTARPGASRQPATCTSRWARARTSIRK